MNLINRSTIIRWVEQQFTEQLEFPIMRRQVCCYIRSSKNYFKSWGNPLQHFFVYSHSGSTSNGNYNLSSAKGMVIGMEIRDTSRASHSGLTELVMRNEGYLT